MSASWFVLEINPEPWEVGPVGVARHGQKLKPYIGRSQQLDAYKQAVREELGTGYTKIEGKVKLTFYFWRNMAEYKTETSRTNRANEADATNLAKSTEDALQGILFENDKDTNDIRSILVAQGPEVKGRVVFSIESSPDLPDAVAELPSYICELMDIADDEVPGDDTLAWGDDRDVF